MDLVVQQAQPASKYDAMFLCKGEKDRSSYHAIKPVRRAKNSETSRILKKKIVKKK